MISPGCGPAQIRPGATLVTEGTRFTFNNTNITASARSDVEAAVSVPEPASLALLGVGLAGLAASRRRKLS